MSRPVVVTVGPLAAASANVLATSQTPVSGTALTLASTVLDKPRRVLLTFGNEASNRTLVLSGTNWQGDKISETLAVASGAGGTVASVLDYATVTSGLPAGGGWTAAVTLGTNGVGASPWVAFDSYYLPQVAIQTDVAGTVNYTIQTTMDDPNSPTNPVLPSAMTWLSSSDVGVVGATASAASSFSFAPAWARTLLNSGSGSVTTTFSQLGFRP